MFQNNQNENPEQIIILLNFLKRVSKKTTTSLKAFVNECEQSKESNGEKSKCKIKKLSSLETRGSFGL